MQYSGYWVSGDEKQVIVTRATFDDTDLSEASDWKKAHQNEDTSAPHGFILWEDTVVDIRLRLDGKIASLPQQDMRDD